MTSFYTHSIYCFIITGASTDVDVASYLRQYQHGIVTTAIRESLRQTESEAKQRVADSMHKEWSDMRKAIRTKGHLKSTAPNRTTPPSPTSPGALNNNNNNK